jgi:DNA-binding transcriptional LysR family regulator
MQTLRLFCDVARHQSFSRAAAENGVTQSAASQRIGQLERKLGVTLIDRSVRPLALTQAGDIFLHEVRDLVERYDQLERRVSRLRPDLEGPVVVDAIYSAGIDLLNTLQESFEALHPGVSVSIHYKQPEEVYQGVRQELCDLGIVSFPQTWRDVVVIPLRDEPMAVVCAPAHALAGRRKARARDLDGLEMAAFEPELPVGRRIRKYLRDHDATPEVVSEFDNIDTIKTAVAVTDQFAILPKRTVMREVQAGTLAAIDLEPALARPIGIIHRRRKGAAGLGAFGPAVQAFVDYLLGHAGPSVDLVARVRKADKDVVTIGGRS